MHEYFAQSFPEVLGWWCKCEKNECNATIIIIKSILGEILMKTVQIQGISW